MIVTVGGWKVAVGEGTNTPIVLFPAYDVSCIGHCQVMWENDFGFCMLHESGEMFYACDGIDTNRLEIAFGRNLPVLIFVSTVGQLLDALLLVRPDTTVHVITEECVGSVDTLRVAGELRG